ncbi:GNAT family N-acetyltransferase [Streptomyces sp. NPDC059785]|uniref:GNAT family N-acetyltransferase n=1 Tax=unclassified Streptomyces TaxID=2593676 RepID=UPI003655CA83
MSHDVRVRPICDADWPDIAALEAAAYASSSLSEGQEALESRGRISPATCFVLDVGERVGGYVLALPYPVFQYPDLARAERTAFRSRNLHLHDMVVAAELRGRGLGTRLLGVLTAAARPAYERMSLVAVGGMADFWARRGYRPHAEVGLPHSYGDDAVYMSAEVPGSTRTDGLRETDFHPCSAS